MIPEYERDGRYAIRQRYPCQALQTEQWDKVETEMEEYRVRIVDYRSQQRYSNSLLVDMF